MGGHHEAGRAKAALHGAGVDEGALDRAQLAARAEALDGGDLAALGLAGEHQARADEEAVEVDRAGAALALFAGVLRAHQAEVLAQQLQQAGDRLDALGDAAHAVHVARHPHRRPPRYSCQHQASALRPRTARARLL